jgi:predicted AAA+ superfamily ATPase
VGTGASYSAQELSYTKILGQLLDAGNTVTLAHYLELLDKANILCGLPKYSGSKLREKKARRALWCTTRLFIYGLPERLESDFLKCRIPGGGWWKAR